MSALVLAHDPNEKQDTAHVETRDICDDEKVDVHPDSGLMKSPIDDLSIWKTVWIFKRVVLFVVLVYTGYVCEGFELSAGGTIVANNGFIKQFGSRAEEGVRALDPTWCKFVMYSASGEELS